MNLKLDYSNFFSIKLAYLDVVLLSCGGSVAKWLGPRT